MHYLVVSTTQGQIKVFKWDRTESKQTMHSFKSHTKAISSLSKTSLNPAYIVSASLDGFIKIWCLEKMIDIYHFEVYSQADGGLGDTMDKVEMIDDNIYAIYLKGHSNAIEIGTISHLTTCFFISKPLIERVEKGFHSRALQRRGDPQEIIVSFDNNSILLLDSQTGKIKSTVYPPPTPTTICQIEYQMSLSRLILLMTNGSIAMYRTFQRETATLEFLQEAKHLKDAEDKNLSGCTITDILLTPVVPPYYDCELFQGGEKDENKKKARFAHKQRNSPRSDSPRSVDLCFEDNEEHY